MASPAVFWETLRSRGIADAAPLFVQAGVVSLSEVQGSWQKLLDAGIPRWQLEVLLAGPTGPALTLPQWRSDAPPVRKRQSASFNEALRAGEPSERAKALEELDSEILATTTIGPYESRLQVWRRLCAKWEVSPFGRSECSGGRCLLEAGALSLGRAVLFGGGLISG